ncbi:FtsX-like permease family protein [Streptomyces sp. NPDC047928]|uniref:FtsX-like permease family protein n=1 Tax=unclassified Streptomyces TaxID=2593676 RepID=UPI00371433DF
MADAVREEVRGQVGGRAPEEPRGGVGESARERNGGSARRARAAAPWVRTRLRTAPGPAVALALLVLVTSFLAAAFPRAVDAYEGAGLRAEVSGAAPERSGIELTSPPAMFPDERGDPSMGHAWQAERQRRVLAALPAPLRAEAGQSAYGVRVSTPVPATDGWLPELDGGSPVFTLSTQAGVGEHAKLRSGRLARAAEGSVTASTATVEAVVTSATADALDIRVGSTVHVPRVGSGAELAVRITGIVEPVRPDLGYWSFEPVLRTPARLLTQPPVPRPYWHGALLLAPEAAPVLPSVSPDTELYWRVAVDLDGLGPDGRDALRDAVAAVEGGPAQAELSEAISPELFVESGVDDIIADFDRALAAVDPVVAVAAFGVGGVGGVVLVMAGGLAAARRHDELSLLRARGASVRGIAGRLLAEVAVPVLPAAALGCALAFVLVPDGRPLPALVASGAVAVVACAALPLRAAYAHRRPRVHGEREDLVRARPSRRRTVAELALAVLTVAAVVALRRRGTAGGDADQLLSAAPLLVGLIAALLLVRLQPLPLRLAALTAARRRGAVGFLSLARAGRSPAAAAPLLALLVALTTAAFGGSVLAGISAARDGAALAAVGADARIDADPLPDTAIDAVRGSPGVADVTAVHGEYDLDVGGGGTGGVTLLAVDPDSYARFARRTGLGAFPADALRAAPGRTLPAIASPGVAERLGDGDFQIGPDEGGFTVRVVLVREVTPADATRGDFLMVDASGLPGDRTPNALLVHGTSLSATALGAAARTADGDATVTLRSAERARFADSPVQRGAERVYTVAATACAGYAVLALLLTLLRAAPERAALLARLRTMGLTRRQGRRLLVLESLPQALTASVGGALVGWATIRLLAPGVDLGQLALASAQARFGPTGPVPLRADPWSLLLPTAAVVVVAVGVAAAQAWTTTRRTTTTELRAGDTR